jgi:RND family efflux transporter MFP subunit
MAEFKGREEIGSLRIDRDKKYNDRPKSRVWRWIVGLLAVVAVIAAYFIFQERITPATKVRTATATLLTGSEAAAELVASGYVVAQRKAEVASKGTGRLEFLGFEEGDTVRAGQVIAELDNDDIEAQLMQARAELQFAEVDSLNSGRQHRRARGLFDDGAIRETELEEAETAYLRAQARVSAAAAAVKAAEVALENTYIRAPFDGTVLTKNADVGEIVAPFASSANSKGSVVTLADMTSLEVEADVSESNIQKVAVGQPCEIILDAYPSVRYPAVVKKIVPTADRARATVQVKVAFDSIDDRVLPEMSARVNFFVNRPDQDTRPDGPVIVVPDDAVTTRGDDKVVFVIDESYVTLRPVELGRELSEYTEVLSGLEEGEKVVLSPPGKMETGQKIEITY